jgi:hypothetical protein
MTMKGNDVMNNGFIDLLLQNMSGGRPQRTAVGAGREGFGIRKPGRTDVLPPPLPDRISQLGSQKLINLPNAKRPQQELPVIDQTDIETPNEDVDVTSTYQQPQTSQSENILRQTMQSIADLQNKEYTKGKGGFKDILKGLGLGALDAFSKADPRQGLAGMLGAATGGAAGLGVRSAIDSSADDRFIDERKMNKLYQDAAAQGQIADADTNRTYKRKAIENMERDDINNQQWRQDQIAERKATRAATALNTKMRTVASMLSKVENYNPADPRFAAMTTALGDVGLPLTPKDVKKKVQMVQDAETGAWTLTLTDPLSGQQEVRPVLTKDGSQLSTTSSSKVMANSAGERQDKGFAHDERMTRLRADIAKNFADFKAKLDESNAEKDQTRKLALQQEAERLRQITVNLRKELDGVDQ